MADFVIFNPEKKPTLKVTISSKAANLPKEERMLRRVSFKTEKFIGITTLFLQSE